MHPSGNIYLRVFLPFSAALVLATLLAWWLATSLLIDALERRLEQQLEHAGRVLAEGQFPLTRELLLELSKLLQVEIVLIGDGGAGLSTLYGRQAELTDAVLSAWAQAGNATYPLTLNSGNVPYRVVIQPLPRARNAHYAAVAMLASLGDVRTAARQAAGWLGVAAMVGLLALAWIGHRITQSITIPIRELANMATRLTAGDREVRSSLHQANEIGVLADALNKLVERLSGYEAEVAENSRLAAIGQTTARITHEIRNPLTAIKLQVQLLQETLPPEQWTITAPLLDEIRRLDLIVSSTLDLSRPVRLVTHRADLNQLVTEVAQLSAAQFAHRGIRLELALTPQPSEVTVDAARIKQLLWNLLVNAGDELLQGGIIRLATVTQPGGLMLTLEDSGPGIPQDRRATLFSASASHKPGGFGLGLALCREIVELHGGRIDLGDSALGGAKFSIQLPLTPA